MVARAEDFKLALLASMKESEVVEIDLEGVSRIDLAILQILYSAQRTAEAKGAEIRIRTPVQPFYKDLLITAGFM